MVDIPTIEPEQIRAGDTIKWTKSNSDYLASAGWTLTYTLNKSGTKITFDATADDDDFSVTITAATSANYTPGTYHWVSHVTKGAERYTLDKGVMEILANLATITGGYDARSHVKKVLDAIEAVIETRATKEQKSYEIKGRSLEYLSPAELIQWRSFYKSQYDQELAADRVADGLGHNKNTYVRFI